MKAIILAGGLGTRLPPVTFAIPKPLLPVGDKPILQIIISQIRNAGIDEITLAAGYQAEPIKARSAGTDPNLARPYPMCMCTSRSRLVLPVRLPFAGSSAG
jgi:NDP-sugar pyrophosphorylase family protein